MHALLKVNTRHHVLVGKLTSVAASALIMNLEDLAVNKQAGHVPKLLWLARLDSVR